MTSATQAAYERRERWLLIALCTASVSFLMSSSVHANDATTPSVSNNTRGDVVTSALSTAANTSPAGAYFVSITANGTGCPAGSMQMEPTSNGEFLLKFSSFEREVDSSTAAAVTNCQLTLNFRSPSNFRYAVNHATYHGYSYLEDGVSMRQTTSYHFRSSPSLRKEARSDYAGLYDDSYLIVDSVKDADLNFSSCASDQHLDVFVTMRLLNANPRKKGYVNLDTIRLSTVAARCDESPPAQAQQAM